MLHSPPKLEQNTVPDAVTGSWRDLWAYWILGLCNNNAFVVMLSAAHDIIRMLQPNAEYTKGSSHKEEKDRVCNVYSTGIILFADIVPALCLKVILPFLPLWINGRIMLAVSFSIASLLIVSFATVDWLAILGVALTSVSCGIRETALMSYSVRFDPDVISTWSSGIAAAGVIGSFSYALMRNIGLSMRTSLLLMLIYPIIEMPVFWILLRVPLQEPRQSRKIHFSDEGPFRVLWNKLETIPEFTGYMAPLCTMCFLEYFINMGLYEFIHFNEVYIDREAQFRWFCVVYEVGVFISCATVSIFTINKIWLLALFQAFNVVYFITEAVWFHTPSIVITLCLVFWEGCLGGAAYVNTFYRMAKNITPNKRLFSMSVVWITDSFGVMLAGIISVPVHKKICSIPERVRNVIVDND